MTRRNSHLNFEKELIKAEFLNSCSYKNNNGNAGISLFKELTMKLPEAKRKNNFLSMVRNAQSADKLKICKRVKSGLPVTHFLQASWNDIHEHNSKDTMAMMPPKRID